jgi:hypothetical protein
MNRLSLRLLAALILTAVGVAAAAGLLEPMHSRTMTFSWGIVALPLGLLLLMRSARAALIARWVIYASAGIVMLGTLIMAAVVRFELAPLSPQFADISRSPWYWLQVFVVTLSVAGALLVGAEFVRRITSMETATDGDGPQAGTT